MAMYDMKAEVKEIAGLTGQSEKAVAEGLRIDYICDTWMACNRSEERRVKNALADAKNTATPKRGQELDIVAPAGTTTTRRSYGTGRCAECGRAGSYWNPSAGSYLCSMHWDEY